MNRKYVSENTIDYLSLHDCIIENAKIENNTLVLELGHVDVLDTHPNNPYSVAKCADNVLFHFEKFSVITSEFSDTSKVNKRIIQKGDATVTQVEILKLANGFEVLQVKKLEENEGYNTYQFFGVCSKKFGNDFGEFEIKSQRVLIGWDELGDDAWFVGFNDKVNN